MNCRLRLLGLALLLAAPAVAQQITPAQQAQLDQRYRRQNTNIPPESIINTALTEVVVFDGIVTGRYDRLGPTRDWLRFSTASNKVQRLDSNFVWQAVDTGGGSFRTLVAGIVTNNDIEKLTLQAGTTNISIGHLKSGNTSDVSISVTGAIGPRGFDGIGNLINGGSWGSGVGYSTNTVVTYGNVVYISKQGVTNIVAPPGDPTNWDIWLVGGTNGVNGADGIDGTGFNYRGTWSPVTAYVSNDLVRINSALYQAITNSTAVQPPVTAGWATYWQLVLEDGTDGQIISSTNIFVYDVGSSYPSNAFVVFSGQTYATLQLIAPGDIPGSSTNWVLAAARGAAGANGTSGSDGANGIGNMSWHTNWINTLTYPKDCLVTYNGVIYYSKSINSGVNPETDYGRGTWGIAAQALDGAPGVYMGYWTNTTSYTNRALVRQTNTFYYSLSSGNVGNSPYSAPLYWTYLFDAPSTSTLSGVRITGPAATNTSANTIEFMPGGSVTGLVSAGSTVRVYTVAGSVTNARATNDFLTASVVNGEAVIGTTSTPLFAEADTLQTVLNRGTNSTVGIQLTNATLRLSGDTNSANIVFADGSVMKSANVLGAIVTNETDPIFGVVSTNLAFLNSNNTFAANTTLAAATLTASNTTLTGNGVVLRAQNTGASAYIALIPTNVTTVASIQAASASASMRPVLRYLGSGSADQLLISAGAGITGMSSRREVGSYGDWGNQINSGLEDTGMGMMPGRSFWVSRAKASLTAGDCWLLFNLDPAASYSGSYISLNQGRMFRTFNLYGLTNTVLSISMTNNTGAFVGRLTSTSNEVALSTTNQINAKYTNSSGTRWIGYISVTLTNDGTGYAAAGFEVGGQILSKVQMSQSGTNVMFMSAPVSVNQTWCVTNLSAGGSVGFSIFTQGRE